MILVYGFPLKCQREGLWADHGGMSETPNRPFMCKDDGVDKKNEIFPEHAKYFGIGQT